jgi:hypothetical protein
VGIAISHLTTEKKMVKKKKQLNLDDRIDSIIDLLEDLRYEQSNKVCENCQDDDDIDTNINDEDEENE